MNKSGKYTQYNLPLEMLESVELIRNFSTDDLSAVVDAVNRQGKLYLGGEGSSRIFPAKNAIYKYLQQGGNLHIITEGCRQAAAYNLADYVCFAASNSGSTKEAIELFNQLKRDSHEHLFALTATAGSHLTTLANASFVLNCGKENAVAATKSVIEQGLFYEELLAQLAGGSIKNQLISLADAVETALTQELDPAMINRIAKANIVYFAGKNCGVAEELTLKTNEAMRKSADFLEGTYCVHGIEEVMDAGDVVILIDPFPAELEKIKQTLVDGVGIDVFTISTEPTGFDGIILPKVSGLQNFVYLAAGWNILVEAGFKLGINMDKTERARKVGNAFEAA